MFQETYRQITFVPEDSQPQEKCPTFGESADCGEEKISFSNQVWSFRILWIGSEVWSLGIQFWWIASEVWSCGSHIWSLSSHVWWIGSHVWWIGSQSTWIVSNIWCL
jgi:hypothetical protein